jgi:RNA polymerase sigma-70 factor (ECF subfamily)
MGRASEVTDASWFATLIERLRSGDALAAAELVRRYEPAIRRAARLRMIDQRLRRIFDSMDVCQSVLASFFVRATAGQWEWEGPEELLRFLVAMTRNQVALKARQQRAMRRDHRRMALGDPGGPDVDVADTSPDPSRIVAGRELLDEFRRRLTDEERRLADLRAQGRGWAEIAAELGGTAQARRKQLARAAARVAQELGLEEDDGE